MELRVNEVAIPEKIDFNYEELKAELTSKVSFYETLVYTDDQIKDAKADKANLNKLKRALNDERIRREKEYMQPFNVFKAQINEIIGTKEAQFQMGYKGYIQLAIRSGQYKRLNVVAIKEGELEYFDPLNEDIKVNLMVDDWDKREEAETIGYYAMFELVNGFRKTMYWSKAQMLAHADKYSPAFYKDAGKVKTKYGEKQRVSFADYEAGNYDPRDSWMYSSFWYKNFDGMAYKTMLRQLISKWGVMSIELQKAFEGDMATLDVEGHPTYVENDKIELATDSGFEVDKSRINKALKPHQGDAVVWALKGGRRALFESFGLGKTAQEIEFCHQAAEHTGGRALIVLPLGVKQEFTRDAVELLGYEKPEYCRTMEEVEASTSQIVLTNYERVRDGDIDPSYFAATSLDEASVLRSFGSKTYQTFLDKFKNVPYKLVATATPSPNKYKELIHYAGYLEVMDTGQALTRFFQRDSTKANNLTLYPNMEDEFWLWVSSWALFITKPSDLNPDYSDDGYVLPPLDVRWHEIPIHYGDSVDRDGQMELFTQASTGLKEAAKIKRESIDARVEKMKEIVDSSPEDHFILWHDQEAERHAIKKVLPETVDIYGSMDYDIREQRVIDFSNGKTRLFATKKSISGSGCNFQRHCHREIFVGIDYEFNDFIQAVHRCYRFLQQDTVVIDIIYMENEREIDDNMYEWILTALTEGVRLKLDGREFGRMVRNA